MYVELGGTFIKKKPFLDPAQVGISRRHILQEMQLCLKKTTPRIIDAI